MLVEGGLRVRGGGLFRGRARRFGSQTGMQERREPAPPDWEPAPACPPPERVEGPDQCRRVAGAENASNDPVAGIRHSIENPGKTDGRRAGHHEGTTAPKTDR